ncbi:uncharacterized protein KGF55_002067 [Candida pseudojiufengensis]|uniref:uncharacterized protein n=1 Tax=Candida pseudojiufengensis TaxID=497109 RepID=UPI0022247702|nr:uncharacterized protein KGF55_002067 [Candida pseudojiufengensis]KAI5964125.1 hypothetical protein KGF55_002067 [Candida pseudojiufengensis]
MPTIHQFTNTSSLSQSSNQDEHIKKFDQNSLQNLQSEINLLKKFESIPSQNTTYEGIGYIKSSNYYIISNKEILINLKSTLKNLDFNKIDLIGLTNFYNDSIVYYLSSILNVSITEILNSLNYISPKQLIILNLISNGNNELNFNYNNILNFQKFNGLKGMTKEIYQQLKCLVRFDEGLLIIVLCLFTNWKDENSLYQVIIENEIYDLQDNQNVIENGDVKKNDNLKKENENCEFDCINLLKKLNITCTDHLQCPLFIPIDKFEVNDAEENEEKTIIEETNEDKNEDKSIINTEETEDKTLTLEDVSSDQVKNGIKIQNKLESTPAVSNQSNNETNGNGLNNNKSSKTSSSTDEENNENNSSEDLSDSDHEYFNLLDSLADLFPKFSKSELKIRLNSTKNFDELIEELFIETESRDILEEEEEEQEEQQQQQQEEETIKSNQSSKESLIINPGDSLSKDVYFLKELFPQIELKIIDFVLKQNNGDINETSNSLLTNPNPNIDETIEDQQQVQNKRQDQNQTQNQNQWFQVSNLVDRIKKILNIETNISNNENNDENKDPDTESLKLYLNEEDIIHHIRKSQNVYYDALIGIINECQPKIKKSIQIVPKSNGSSRVQRGGISRTLNSKIKPSTTTTTKLVSSTYKYNPNLPEVLDLWHIYSTNKSLQFLNKEFLIKALEFFQGNCEKVIELAFELNENKPDSLSSAFKKNGKSKVTKSIPIIPNTTMSFTPYVENSNNSLNQNFEKYNTKRRRSSGSNSQLSSTTSTSTSSLNSIQLERYNNYLQNSELDLHRLTSIESLQLIKFTLKNWWSTELKLRIEDGKLNKYGSIIKFIDPLLIITGRGIHSINGQSIIRKFVKDYLFKNKFIFDEELGIFFVKGKKS